jgi:hypothetical protein
MNNKQEQAADGGSTAIQAAGNINITIAGPSLVEIKEIALDVFRSNFYELKSIAKETAEERAELFLQRFLMGAQKINPNGIEQGHNPAFQIALYNATKSYAISGNDTLADVLIELLKERSSSTQRSLTQIVLEEAINTAGSLTDEHLSAMSACFIAKHREINNFIHHHDFATEIDNLIKPYLQGMRVSAISHQFLIFKGCIGHTSFTETPENIIMKKYSGCFMAGIDNPENEMSLLGLEYNPKLFIRCLNNENKFQIAATNQSHLRNILKTTPYTTEQKSAIERLYVSNIVDDSEVKEICIKIRDCMADYFINSRGSLANSNYLTPIGIAIAHANISRATEIDRIFFERP